MIKKNDVLIYKTCLEKGDEYILLPFKKRVQL